MLPSLRVLVFAADRLRLLLSVSDNIMERTRQRNETSFLPFAFRLSLFHVTCCHRCCQSLMCWECRKLRLVLSKILSMSWLNIEMIWTMMQWCDGRFQSKGKKDILFLCRVLSIMLSDTDNNNLSLSVVKTNTFSGRTLAVLGSPNDDITARLAAAVCSVLHQYLTSLKECCPH